MLEVITLCLMKLGISDWYQWAQTHRLNQRSIMILQYLLEMDVFMMNYLNQVLLMD